MTVEELINKLQKLPKDLEVQCERNQSYCNINYLSVCNDWVWTDDKSHLVMTDKKIVIIE
jgi:hypothetical protein